MANHESRVAKLEQAGGGMVGSELPVMVWGDGDSAEAVAAARRNNNWPDDAAHPVRIVRVRWQRPDKVAL